ncbi:MAG: class I SAM-dependent methyltransferase [Christensenellaceae bacterium]
MNEADTAQQNAQMYTEYNAQKGENRNSLLYNKQTVFQYLAQWQSKINALQFISPDAKNAKVLDVGCGDGESLLLYLQMGFDSANMHGIDIWDELIDSAKKRLPAIDFICGDASKTDFAEGTFDIVTESTMFLQITDNKLAKSIAQEMIRVLKPGGYLVITDWTMDKRNGEYLAVNKKRVKYLFDVDVKTELIKKYRGALVPPIGRLLSGKMPALYMPIKFIFPFLCGMKTYVLKKK